MECIAAVSQVCSAALLVRSLATATGHLEYKGSQEKKKGEKGTGLVFCFLQKIRQLCLPLNLLLRKEKENRVNEWLLLLNFYCSRSWTS